MSSPDQWYELNRPFLHSKLTVRAEGGGSGPFSGIRKAQAVQQNQQSMRQDVVRTIDAVKVKLRNCADENVKALLTWQYRIGNPLEQRFTNEDIEGVTVPMLNIILPVVTGVFGKGTKYILVVSAELRSGQSLLRTLVLQDSRGDK